MESTRANPPIPDALWIAQERWTISRSLSRVDPILRDVLLFVWLRRRRLKEPGRDGAASDQAST